MLAPGDKLPDFECFIAHPDGKRERFRFSSVLGRGPVVLSFFPLAFTRVCTSQVCDMRDHMAHMNDLHAQVLGFSCDSPAVNAAYIERERLTFSIISDPNREAVGAIWETETVVGVQRVPRRGWMVVDKEGRVVELHVAERSGDPWVGHAAIEAALAKAA